MSKKYTIGQVLYIVSANAVIPVQIKEITQKTTIEGEQIFYMVNDAEDHGPYDLNDINGAIYNNVKGQSCRLRPSQQA